MKSRLKLFFFVALALTAVLSFSVFTVNASAVEPEREETLNVVACNLSFRDNVCIKYAVDSTDSDTKMLVWSNSQAEYLFGSEDYVLETVGYQLINENKCLIFDFTELTAKQMTDDVFACAYNNGNYGKVVKYSILRYAYDAINGVVNAELTVLLQSMLDYGADAQLYFEYKTDRLASADFYKIKLVGGTLDDGTKLGLFTLGETVNITAPQTADGKIFYRWVDELDTVVSYNAQDTITVGNLNKVYTAVYATPSEVCNALGHNMTLNATPAYRATEATCLQPATYHKVCTRCESLSEETYASGNALGHSYRTVANSRVEPTCLVNGNRENRKCDRCDDVIYGDVLPATGHHFHKESPNNTPTHHGCSNLGCTVIEPHEFGVDGICTICEYNAPFTLNMDYTLTADGLGYNVAYGSATDSNVIIPSEHNGLPVLGIAYQGFYNKSGITQVNIPNSVTKIDRYAFSGSSNIVTINTSENLVSIGEYAFRGCSKLTAITIPSGVTEISDNAFRDCSALANITWHDAITALGRDSFCGCAALSLTTLPSSLDTITFGAFNGCKSIVNLTLPNGLTSIEGYAFCNCSELLSIDVPNSVQTLGINAFANCVKLPSVNIPGTVQVISDNAFTGCTALETVTLNNGTQTVGSYAFYNMGVTSITLPSTLRTINASAFNSCSKLASVTLNNGLESIGDYAFSNCRELTEIEIPSSVTTLGKNIFASCAKLVTAVLNEGIATVSDSMFASCAKLASVTLPCTVTTIGGSAFNNCQLLSNVVIPSGVTSIGNSAFIGCGKVTSITIPSGLTAINNSAFEGTGISTATIPLNATIIGKNAFRNCKSLQSVEFAGNLVNTIDNNAFDGCSNLTSFDMPNSVTVMGTYVFSSCTKLATVNLSNSLTTIREYAFNNCSSLTALDLPNSVTAIYSRAFCNSGLVNFVVPDCITNLNNAFYGCNKLTYLKLPENLTTLNSSEFYGCSSLAEVFLPYGITNIPRYVFQGCNSLVRVVIPNSVATIEANAFNGANNIPVFYYEGTVEEYNAIDITFGGYSNSNDVVLNLENADNKVAFYSESEPAGEGRYWHYVSDVPTLWEVGE